ncbi:uncharacterized protein LOC117572733 [Drosophila albomicans]|uniref:Uncharacterized protein LOC117572733 n=1 Tax=Drosophila albomicans TaxID=7291 RepID=A0A6P8X648_DROAB|nr:uncharacterized protein LOC117572733 [Drosophila albomicans]
MSDVLKTDKWIVFFRVYGRLPAFWKVTDEGYKSKRAKIEGYQKLLKSYRKIYPGANVDNMRRKINRIRCSFHRELRKVKLGELSARNKDDVNEPKLWYFKEFLRNDIAEDTSDVVREKEATDEEKPMVHFDQNDVIEIEPISKDIKPIAINTACPEPVAPIATVAPIAPRAEQPEVVDHQKLEEAKIFAEDWAISYCKLDAHNGMLAKKAIEEIFVLGQLKKLQYNSVMMP